MNILLADGLISIRGMEKSMRVTRNVITNNRGVYMVEFKANSQSEIRGELRAVFFENLLKKNIPPSPEVLFYFLKTLKPCDSVYLIVCFFSIYLDSD